MSALLIGYARVSTDEQDLSAQLATLAKYPHPYYWAAFQMSGLF